MWSHILFDLDGTLTNPAEGITGSVRHAMQQLGYPVPPQQELERFIGPPLDVMFAETCGFNKQQVALAIDHFRSYFSTTGINQNLLYPGIKPMLSQLIAQGKTLYIATSKPTVFANQVLQNFSLSSYFSYVSGSPLSHSGTPKAQIVQTVLQNCGICADSAVMVGDRLHDVHGAHQNGLPCVGVLFGFGGRAELEDAGCDYIAKDTSELSRILLSGGTN